MNKIKSYNTAIRILRRKKNKTLKYLLKKI